MHFFEMFLTIETKNYEDIVKEMTAYLKIFSSDHFFQ